MKDFSKICFNIIVNEVTPRLKKNSLKYDDFPSNFVKILAVMEFLNLSSRKDSRRILDEHVKWVIDGRKQDEVIL